MSITTGVPDVSFVALGAHVSFWASRAIHTDEASGSLRAHGADVTAGSTHEFAGNTLRAFRACGSGGAVDAVAPVAPGGAGGTLGTGSSGQTAGAGDDLKVGAAVAHRVHNVLDAALTCG